MAVIQDLDGVVEHHTVFLQAGTNEQFVPVLRSLSLFLGGCKLPSGQPVTSAEIVFKDDFKPEPALVHVYEAYAYFEMTLPMSVYDAYLRLAESGQRLGFVALYEPDGGRLLRFHLFSQHPSGLQAAVPPSLAERLRA